MAIFVFLAISLIPAHARFFRPDDHLLFYHVIKNSFVFYIIQTTVAHQLALVELTMFI